jgi:hypothetical protein
MASGTQTARLGLLIAAMLVSNYAPIFAAQDRTVLPLPEPKFEGVIGKTYKESKEAWPKLPTPPASAPVSNTYKPPFAFNGEIKKVAIELQ